jgi:DNA-binding transcriptional LysR family regulator
LAETSSFTAAAKICNVSQPGLSAAIREFEAELGVRLFHRDTRNVCLTPEGEALLPLAEITLINSQQAAHDIRELIVSKRTSVRIAAVSSMVSFLLPAALARLGAEAKLTKIEVMDLQDYEVHERVMDGRADIGIGLGPIDPTTFEADFLFSNNLSLVVHESHRLAQHTEITWSEAGLEPIVIYKPTSHFYQVVEGALAIHGIRFAPVGTYTFRQSLFGIAMSGTAVTMLPSLSLKQTMPRGLVQIPLVDPVINRQYFITTRRGRTMTQSGHDLRNYLRMTLQALWFE